jgi:hypothetical protein
VSDYPPSTQSDDSSPLYRSLVKQHELRQLGQIDRERVDWAIATRFAEVKPVEVGAEDTPQQEPKPLPLPKPPKRICPICKCEMPEDANPASLYCSNLCRLGASKLQAIKAEQNRLAWERRKAKERAIREQALANGGASFQDGRMRHVA